ncbi:cyclase family protein [Paenibacillus sp. 481]|uniref:cyclase family protein n=1 Tax=Paenibacillus sp. 481 TaxID=2835869 RepID=UPI001E420DD8|nr:cyclase family protein [Paenibacillus sp. 481]UHA71926.1 cyclase family protein [Paenibacillus sp. 481]
MIIDLTRLIVDKMPVFPGDTETTLIQSKFIQQHHYNNHQLTINMHVGTHIDGPMHMTDTHVYLSDFPLDSFIGEGCVLDVSGEMTIDYKVEYEQSIKENSIVILYTGYGKYFDQAEYFTAYPVLTKAFVDILVRKKVKMIGMDTPSPDKYPFEIHAYLFENTIFIAENLTNVERLLDVESFEIIALPLHIKADSSIARIIARVK